MPQCVRMRGTCVFECAASLQTGPNSVCTVAWTGLMCYCWPVQRIGSAPACR